MKTNNPPAAEVWATPSRGAQLVAIGSDVASVLVFGLAASGVAAMTMFADLPRPVALVAVAGLVVHAFGRIGLYEIVQGRLKLRAYIRRGVGQN